MSPEPAVPAIPATAGARPVWLRVGCLVDGGTVARDAHVVYDAHAIRFVGTGEHTPPRHVLRPGQDAPDYHDPAATILPGLSDAHTHLFLEGGELDPGRRSDYLRRAAAELLEAAVARLERLVRLGVTAVRDAGDRHDVGLDLARRYAAAHRPLMPYVDSPGAAIHRRGRYGSFMGEPLEECPSLEACVQERVRRGADRIKLIATGIIDFERGAVTAPPQLNTGEVRRLVQAATSSGRQTLAHASGEAGIECVIEGGVDSVEHGFFVRDDQLARMRDRHTAWVPTLAPVQAQLEHAVTLGWNDRVVDNLRRILDRHAGSVRRAAELGVIVLAGSDAGSAGVPHGLGLLRELELLEAAGLSPLAVVHAATGAAADRLAFRERFGRIQPGYLPRMLVTRHSPLEGIANLRKARTVVVDGRVLESDGLDPAGL